MFLTMKIRTFTGWLLAVAVLAFAAGVSVGGGYTVHQADGVIEELKTQYQALKNDRDQLANLNAKLQNALRSVNGAAGKLLDRANQDDAAAADDAGFATVIYETSPELRIRFTGIRGLPILPLPGNGQQLPRVLIPGRVHPMILAPDGDARQAVFFYVNREMRLDGPYLPEVVRPQ
jgi:cell division protein FtsB